MPTGLKPMPIALKPMPTALKPMPTALRLDIYEKALVHIAVFS